MTQTKLHGIEKAKAEAIDELRDFVRVTRIGLTTYSDNLVMIPDILQKIQEVHDRLELIENCLKNQGFLEDDFI